MLLTRFGYDEQPLNGGVVHVQLAERHERVHVPQAHRAVLRPAARQDGG